MIKKILILSTFWLLSTLAGASEADSLAYMKGIQSDPAALQAAIEAGRQRASLCRYCHGETGSSERDYIPNLAGQDPTYLVHQLEQFISGARKQSVMEGLAKNITMEDRVNLVLFYSSNKPVRRFDIQGDIAQGRVGFEGYCMACHGPAGKGQGNAPRLASQPQTYLKQTLSNLKLHSDERTVQEMEPILNAIDAKMIVDISAYLAAID